MAALRGCEDSAQLVVQGLDPATRGPSDGHAPFTARPKAHGNTEAASQPAMRTRIAGTPRQDESQVTWAENWTECLFPDGLIESLTASRGR